MFLQHLLSLTQMYLLQLQQIKCHHYTYHLLVFLQRYMLHLVLGTKEDLRILIKVVQDTDLLRSAVLISTDLAEEVEVVEGEEDSEEEEEAQHRY